MGRMSAASPAASGFDALGFELARALGPAAENLVLSPVSVGLVLAMTWAGSRGETADQIARAIGLAGPREAALDALGALAGALAKERARTELHLATRLFSAKGRGLSRAFVDLCERACRAGCEEVDFAADPEKARRLVNAWTARATKDRVREILPQGAVDRDTQLVLDSAVYLKARWAEPFDAAATAPGPFRVGSEVRQVQKMVGTKHAARAGVGPGLRALELPYSDGQTSLLVLVPDDESRFAALGAELSPALVEDLVAGLSEGSLLVHLPRLDASGGAALPLSPALRAVGIEAALDRSRADLRDIADPPDPKDRLFVAEVFHQAALRLDEDGTEAAAATAAVFGPLGAAPAEPTVFDVDRPFYYLVRDAASGATLFFGRARDPGASA